MKGPAEKREERKTPYEKKENEWVDKAKTGGTPPVQGRRNTPKEKTEGRGMKFVS